jgi:hypothetical protein
VAREKAQRDSTLWGDTLEMLVYETCIACVSPSQWTHIVSTYPPFENSLRYNQDFCAFIYLAASNLPAGEIMRRAFGSSFDGGSDAIRSYTIPVRLGLALAIHLGIRTASCDHVAEVLSSGCDSWCPEGCRVCDCVKSFVDGDVHREEKPLFSTGSSVYSVLGRLDSHGSEFVASMAIVSAGLHMLGTYWKLTSLSCVVDVLVGSLDIMPCKRSVRLFSLVRSHAEYAKPAVDDQPYERAERCYFVGIGSDDVTGEEIGCLRDRLELSDTVESIVYNTDVHVSSSDASHNGLWDMCILIKNLFSKPLQRLYVPVIFWSAHDSDRSASRCVTMFLLDTMKKLVIYFPSSLAFYTLCNLFPVSLFSISKDIGGVKTIVPSNAYISMVGASETLSKGLSITSGARKSDDSIFVRLANALSLTVLCRFVHIKKFCPSELDPEKSTILRSILVRIFSTTSSELRSDIHCDMRIWKEFTQAFLQLDDLDFQDESSTSPVEESSIRNMRGFAKTAMNIYTALRCFLARDEDYKDALIHVRGINVLKIVIRTQFITVSGGGRVSLGSAIPALPIIVRIAEGYKKLRPSEVFVRFGGDRPSSVETPIDDDISATDACRAVYALCATKGILTTEQTRTLFFSVKLMTNSHLPKVSTLSVKTCDRIIPLRVKKRQLSSRRIDRETMFRVFRNLIYLGKFSLSVSVEFLESLTKTGEIVLTGIPLDRFVSERSCLSTRKEGTLSQYRGMVTLGQMLFENQKCIYIGDNAEKDLSRLAQPPQVPESSSSSSNGGEQVTLGQMLFLERKYFLCIPGYRGLRKPLSCRSVPLSVQTRSILQDRGCMKMSSALEAVLQDPHVLPRSFIYVSIPSMF